MKLADHVELIRKLIDKAFRNRLGRMGISPSAIVPIESIPIEYQSDRKRIEGLRAVLIAETGNTTDGYEKLVEEFTFTLFNRLAALKVMEAHTLHPEIVTRRSQHGDRSFSHNHWLEQNPEGRNEEMDGLVRFFENQLAALAADISLFSPYHPYHLLPTAVELNIILNAFNQVDTDAQVEANIWQSDDVFGWLYESYNNSKKAAHKESGEKTEFNKVSIQSQVYTPRWVVKFLVDNSLGKLYLEMYPGSEIKNRYRIANAPKTRTREPKPLTEVKLIDPATGSGNFLLYSFDLFYDLYIDQIDNYGADYDDREIPELIIANNLHGVDLDDRAIQLAQLGLYIKAKRKKRSAKIGHFNIVSSDFYLPEYAEVKPLFEGERFLSSELERIVTDLWTDLQQAFKFGTLIRLEEKFTQYVNDLDRRIESDSLGLFVQEEQVTYRKFRDSFFTNLQGAVAQNTAKQGQSFQKTKTQDAFTFLQLLTQKYDIAVANPPYTDSADFGPELKKFVEANYKQPFKFNSNLYASFISRCCEMVVDYGKVAMVHPPTFMYIKTFEDVRKFLVEKMHISLFVEWGYLGMFNPSARVDSAMYILEKEQKNIPTKFIKLNDIYEGRRYEAFVSAYEDLLSDRSNKHNITLPQEKLKIIEGWPFIYWISDGFREKFKFDLIGNNLKFCSGLGTGENERFMRFWWEVGIDGVSHKDIGWVPIAKGGPYNKWYGNMWLTVNWKENGYFVKNFMDQDGLKKATIRNEQYYFTEGMSFAKAGSKVASFRYIDNDGIFDSSSPAVFTSAFQNLKYSIAFLNSILSSYLIECLNPTAGTQVGDLQRIPFVNPGFESEQRVSQLADFNINTKKQLCSFSIIETNYKQSPLTIFQGVALKDRVSSYLNYENYRLTQVLINEAIINQLIFETYNLSDEDRKQVESKMGMSIGSLPILQEAKDAFAAQLDFPNAEVLDYIKKLSLTSFDDQLKREIKEEFVALYQSNNDIEEFCIRHQVNPINVWYWFKEANILPQARAAEIALEFLADTIRTLLQQDDDGIIPLVGLPGEESLGLRLEKHCLQNGFTAAQYMQLESLLGRPVNEYLEHYFFKNLSDHLNLFMHLPKTPFIWHLSSGIQQGFEAYILIYKWNRDSLYKLKSQYISHRERNLQYRQIQLQEVNTAQAQNEKEKLRLQLQEIEVFKAKIDELIAEGYDPKLDDGVGKNIAPLQKKGLLRAEVLKSSGKNSQLEKYLNADW